MKKQNLTLFRVLKIIILSVLFLSLFSCDEGIFNFSDETGNISLNFTADSSGQKFERIVYSLHNENTGNDLSREVNIDEHDGTQEADSYISRANVGSWSLETALFDYENNLIADRHDDFELELGETVIVEMEYSTSGELTTVFKKPAGSEPESLVSIDNMDSLITGYHQYGILLDEVPFASVLIIQGSGFDSAVSMLGVEYPDGGYFEYTGNWARALGNINVEMNSAYLLVNRSNYFSTGTYSVTLSDINDVESAADDDCSFGFDAKTGMATFDGTAYSLGNILPEMWEKNNSDSAGCYIVYIVDRSDGAIFAGNYWDGSTYYPEVLTPFSLDSDVDTLFLNTADATAGPFGDSYIVIATVDATLTQNELDAELEAVNADYGSYPNLLPDRLPGWLSVTFGDRINYVAVSVTEFTYN